MASTLTTHRKLLYSASVLTCVVLAAELLLRLVNPEIFEFVHTARQLHGYTTWTKVDLRPSTRGTLRLTREDGHELFDFTVTVDERGTRSLGGREHSGPLVVHCIGDSFTMGWGVEDDEAYPARLSELLGPSHRVSNVGVDGYGLLASAEKSRRVAGDRNPDVVIYLFCDNDDDDDQVTAEVAARSNLGHVPWFALDGFRRLSYLANIPFAIKWAAYFAPARRAAADGVMEEYLEGEDLAAALAVAGEPTGDTAEALLDLADRCGARDREFWFVAVDTYPTTLGYVRLCQSRGIDHLLIPLDGRYRIPGDGHLNAEGNRLLARQIHRAITAPAPPRSEARSPGGEPQ